LRPIARDRRKWKELVDNLCSWWNADFIIIILEAYSTCIKCVYLWS
jgi:hypothetical protein